MTQIIVYVQCILGDANHHVGELLLTIVWYRKILMHNYDVDRFMKNSD